MRTIFFVLCVLFITSVTSCEKKNDLGAGCYKGKIENLPNCGGPVVKILEGDLSKIQHEATWTHPTNGTVYTNVFTVKNHCDLMSGQLSDGEEFYFKLIEEPEDESCYICMAAFPVPQKLNNIKVVPASLCGNAAVQ